MNTSTYCHIERSISVHANAEVFAEGQAMLNQAAANEMLITGDAEFSNGNIEKCDALERAYENKEATLCLLDRISSDDLTAITELKALLKGCALEINEEYEDRI